MGHAANHRQSDYVLATRAAALVFLVLARVLPRPVEYPFDAPMFRGHSDGV